METDILSAIQLMLDSRFVKIQNEYLDIQGACFFLGISKSTMYKLNFRKAIPYYRPSGSKKIYYKRVDLENYITQNRLMSQAEINAESSKFLKKGEIYVR